MASKGRQPRFKAYREAGVDIDAGNRAVKLFAQAAKSTRTDGVLNDIGSFGGLFRLQGYQEPVLVSSVDSVGTKVRVAALAGHHTTIGVDLVNHCVNDIFTLGADPLFFLDYYATGHLMPQHVAGIVQSIAQACREVGCALLGGETAEMPGLYSGEDYDIAGFIVGAVERWGVVDGSAIRPGDALLGLPSSGLHTNGYTLVRRIFALEDNPGRLQVYELDLGRTLGEELLEPHRCYYGVLKPHLPQIRGLAHITGGGIVDNLPRILPSGVRAIVRRDTWRPNPIFTTIQRAGNIDDEEMYHVFNMGVGMIVVARPEDVAALLEAVEGSWVLGEVVQRKKSQGPLKMI